MASVWEGLEGSRGLLQAAQAALPSTCMPRGAVGLAPLGLGHCQHAWSFLNTEHLRGGGLWFYGGGIAGPKRGGDSLVVDS